jgi:hypothetical protein
MNSKRILLGVFVLIIGAVALAVVLFQARYCRSVTLRDLRQGGTQTVSISFSPYHVNWKISGNVQGTGVVVVESCYSNQVSGKFSASGRGDYYDTNASVVFIPQGEVTGEVRASFRFDNWY